MNELSITDMMRIIHQLEKDGTRHTLLGIGPMSETLIEAALQLAKEKDFPILFIASRNQVDSAAFGRGYVRNWDQADFVRTVHTIAARVRFDGLCYLCRDHGGPWQRDGERSGKLPVPEAMAMAKRSYRDDLAAGFHLLHIDPTKDPHLQGVVPMSLVLERTVELIAQAEQDRKSLELPPVAYEVGTEETNGGLTSVAAYAAFIGQLTQTLTEKKLPLPLFIVGQTGTLTRLTENIGHFDASSAYRLVKEARQYGVGLKEHNADYLSDAVLCQHPALGVTAANVAPEFGVVETEACLALAETERRCAALGMIDKHTLSLFEEKLRAETVVNGRWRKWLTGENAEKTVQTVLADASLTALITRVGGHYTFETLSVSTARELMYKNLSAAGLNPQKFVLESLKRAMVRYADAFNLCGLTAKIRAAAASAAR